VDRAAAIDRELLVRPAPQRTTLGHALNLLAGAALRYRDRFGAITVPVGVDRVLRPRPTSGTPASPAELKSVSRRAPPCPAV
jgi:hypothetical protein